MSQLDFFLNRIQHGTVSQGSLISGLIYVPNYLNPNEHDKLLSHIDRDGDWSHELKRRVQHYGYKYNYVARSIDASMRIGELPGWCLDIAKRFQREGYVKYLPDQVIVNEYDPGQGIGKHIDCVPCFEEIIASLSLGSDCVMDFTHRRTGEEVSILMEARSLLIFTGDARYLWYHAIAPRKIDKVNGVSYKRKRRVSVTFRKIKLSNVNIDGSATA